MLGLPPIVRRLVGGLETDPLLTRLAADRIFCAAQFQTNHTRWRILFRQRFQFFHLCGRPTLTGIPSRPRHCRSSPIDDRRRT